MPNPIQLEIHRLQSRIDTLTHELPDIELDEELKLDVIESETNALEILDRAVDRIRHEEFLQGAISQRVKEMHTRSHRSKMREDFWRRLAMKIMEMIELRKLQLPEATLSVAIGPRKVIITDDTLIPDDYWRIKRELNKDLIKKEILDGVNVPGAELSNREDALRVLPK